LSSWVPGRGARSLQGRARVIAALAVASWVLPSVLVLAQAQAARTAGLACDQRIETGGRLILRGCSRVAAPGSRAAQGRAAVDEFLARNAAALGLRGDLGDLEVVEEKRGLGSTRVRYRQRLLGLPVHESDISVNQSFDGQVWTVYSDYLSLSAGKASPDIGSAAAEELARVAAGIAALREPATSELVWFKAGGGRAKLAWRMTLYASEPLGDFLTLVDAGSGEILLQENRIAFETGHGMSYRPNPVQASGNPGLEDGGDASSAALDAERLQVSLLGLDPGIGTLKGEFADLVSLAGGLDAPDADEPSRVYNYDRSDDRFEQVVVYDTIDSIQRYFHALGFDDDVGPVNGIRDFPTSAHAHWSAAEQSFYSTADDAIHFGDGGVDDAEDADIVAHEYGHAVQHDQNACWGGGEMGAMGEGFSDYLAASFFAESGDPDYQLSHAACVGEWDASVEAAGFPSCLRRVDTDKMYPGDLVGAVHADGEIWSRVLWDLRAALGGTTADRLILEHHFTLPCSAGMADAALELVVGDAILNAGNNEAVIRDIFCARGILAGADCIVSSGLALELALSPQPLRSGELATYTLTASNESSSTLTGIVLGARVPSGSRFVPGSASHAGAEAGGMVTWPGVDLAPGEFGTRSFQVLLDSGPATEILFSDDMESGAAHWVETHELGTLDWALDAGAGSSPASLQAWFAADPGESSDQRLTLAQPIAVSAGTQVSFLHHYLTELRYDGGVVEYSVDGGASWHDVGPLVVQSGYPWLISGNFESAIANREAFTGDSKGYVETVADLSSLAGFAVQLRFRMVSDTSVGRTGWWVDDVVIERKVNLEGQAESGGGAAETAVLSTPVQPGAAQNAPILVTPEPFLVAVGGSAIVGPQNLKAMDADSGDILTFTITTPPTSGSLNLGATFTQAQVDAGEVVYSHDGSNVAWDSFVFTLDDGHGGELVDQVFFLSIGSLNAPPTLGLEALAEAIVGLPYSVLLAPTDSDLSQSLTVVLVEGPGWLEPPVDNGNGTWSLMGIPQPGDEGSQQTILRVTDSGVPPQADQVTLELVVRPTAVSVPALGPGFTGIWVALLAGLGARRARLLKKVR